MTIHRIPAVLKTIKIIATTTLAFAGWSQSVTASELADALAGIAANTMITRTVSLKEVGLREPVILNSSDARREIFMPVPPGVPLSGTALQLDARYLRGDGGRTTMVVSLDGYPVSSRSFDRAEGDAGLSIGVDGTPRPSGYVRLGTAWSSVLSERACSSERTSGNILEIAPTTSLLYRYDGSQIRDLATAWMALPTTVTLAVSDKIAAKETYDAAWRIGVVLQRAGKRVAVKALPSVGDEIDLSSISVPEALRTVPAFGALVGKGRYRIETPAELGAVFLLNGIHAEVAITSHEFQSRLNVALDALDQSIGASAPDARAVFEHWRSDAMSVAAEPLAPGSVRLLRMAGHPLIAIAEDAGPSAAGLFDGLWRKVGTSRSVVVGSASDSVNENATVPLTRLSGAALSFDVLERGDWSANFSLGDLAADGRIPSELDLDVSAAPGSTTTPPVASVFINDILLGAKRLEAQGQPERIAVSVPSYALKPQNVLRVSFQRQAAGEHCRETPQAYPVSILPTSRLHLIKAPAIDDFVGVIPRMSGPATLIVADRWLTDAPGTLASAISLADASGLSPVRASMVIGSAAVKPSAPFLSLDVPVDGISPKTSVAGGRLIISGRDGANLLNVAGLEDLGAVSVARSGNLTGLVYNTVGPRPVVPEEAITLGAGDVAVIGPKGVLAALDTRNPFGVRPANGDRKTWLQELLGKFAWGGSAAASGLFFLVLARAWHVRRRNSGHKP